MFESGVKCMTRIFVHHYPVDGKTQKSERKMLVRHHSSQIKNSFGNMLLKFWHCEGVTLAEGGWIGGDAMFGLIPSSVELRNE